MYLILSFVQVHSQNTMWFAMFCFSCKMCKDSGAMLLVVALAVFVKMCESKVELNGGHWIILPVSR